MSPAVLEYPFVLQACQLKLGDHEQALQDADSCLELDADHVKRCGAFALPARPNHHQY